MESKIRNTSYNVRDTSKEAYCTNEFSGNNAENESLLIEFLTDHGPATIKMAERKLKIAASTLHSPKGKLIDRGIIMELSKAQCKVTGRNAHYYKVVPHVMERPPSSKHFLDGSIARQAINGVGNQGDLFQSAGPFKINKF